MYILVILKEFVRKIQNAHFIMGCISWLTNNKIIQELEKKRNKDCSSKRIIFKKRLQLLYM